MIKECNDIEYLNTLSDYKITLNNFNKVLVYIENNKAKEDLEHFNLKVRTMGRGYEQDTEFFEAASTAAYYLMEVCNGSRRENHK